MLWSAGAATGVGSLPGTDPAEAMRLVLGELPDLPHLPELPQRGPGADLVGRAAALLVDIHVETTPSGWRLADRPGRDARRARDLLARDLDALEEHAQDYRGPLKLQVAGPWTVTAALERPRGDRALADTGARRDLAVSLAEGLAQHLADVARRVPQAHLVLQLDEPSLPAVLAGTVPSSVGYARVPAVDDADVVDALRRVIGAVTDVEALPLVHCCAARPPVDVVRRSGARGVSLDAGRLAEADDDAIGQAVDDGMVLLLGLVPALGPGVPPTVRDVVQPARVLWGRLGFPAERLADTVVVTPACGLAGASEGWVRTALRLARQAGRVLHEAPEVAR